jgi:glycosyltransferase involved in cell wall biosynthesis
MRGVFEHGVNCYLVPSGDFVSLAEAIEKLRDDPEQREKLARGSQEMYRTELCPNAICDSMLMKIDAIRAPNDQGLV